MNTIYLGLPIIVLGFGLMIWHWRQWSGEHSSVEDPRERKFYLLQFRRRTVVGSLIAIVGSVLTSLQWVSDVYAFSLSIILLLLLLLGILILALSDMLYGLMHHRHGRDAAAARKALVQEYLRLKKASAKRPVDQQSETDR